MPSLSALGRGAECQCLARGLPGASLQLMKVTRSSRGAAGQNWPLSPQPAHTCRRASGTHCSQGDRTPEAPWGSQQEGTEGLGKPSGGEEPLERVLGTRSCSGLEAVGKRSHVMTGNLVFLYQVRGGAEQG